MVLVKVIIIMMNAFLMDTVFQWC